MKLYLSEKKYKVNINGNIYCFRSPSDYVENLIRMLSSEGYILKDSNGLYLIPKEGD